MCVYIYKYIIYWIISSVKRLLTRWGPEDVHHNKVLGGALLLKQDLLTSFASFRNQIKLCHIPQWNVFFISYYLYDCVDIYHYMRYAGTSCHKNIHDLRLLKSMAEDFWTYWPFMDWELSWYSSCGHFVMAYLVVQAPKKHFFKIF